MVFYGFFRRSYWIFFDSNFSGFITKRKSCYSETPTFFVKESSESEGILVDTWNITSTVEVAKYGVVSPVLLFFCSPPIKPQWFVRFT